MGTAFWIRRFVFVLGGAFCVLALVQLLKGHPAAYALREAAVWSLISASIFIAGRFFQARRGQHCALCRDTPEMQSPSGSPRA